MTMTHLLAALIGFGIGYYKAGATRTGEIGGGVGGTTAETRSHRTR